MPLRDHFRPPVDDTVSWWELHGQWPANIVKQLRKVLPAGYVAAPNVSRPLFQAWSHRLADGQPLPTLPLWLSPTRVVPLDLEAGYEERCHDLWLT